MSKQILPIIAFTATGCLTHGTTGRDFSVFLTIIDELHDRVAEVVEASPPMVRAEVVLQSGVSCPLGNCYENLALEADERLLVDGVPLESDPGFVPVGAVSYRAEVPRQQAGQTYQLTFQRSVGSYSVEVLQPEEWSIDEPSRGSAWSASASLPVRWSSRADLFSLVDVVPRDLTGGGCVIPQRFGIDWVGPSQGNFTIPPGAGSFDIPPSTFAVEAPCAIELAVSWEQWSDRVSAPFGSLLGIIKERQSVSLDLIP